MNEQNEYQFACSMRDGLELLLSEMRRFEDLYSKVSLDELVKCPDQFIEFGEIIGEKLNEAATVGIRMGMQMPNSYCLFEALVNDRGDPMQFMAIARAEVTQLLNVIEDLILNWPVDIVQTSEAVGSDEISRTDVLKKTGWESQNINYHQRENGFPQPTRKVGRKQWFNWSEVEDWLQRHSK